MTLRSTLRICVVPALLALSACGSPTLKPAPFTSPVAKAGSQENNASQPVLHIGQMWSYRRTDLWRNEVIERYEQELRMVDADRWTVQWRITDTSDPQRRGSITGEYMDAKTLAFFDPKMTGKHVPLSFPLQPGKKWSFNYGYTPSPGRELKITQEASVAGWETVNVPAGKFRALKVVHEGRYQARDSEFFWTGRIQETYWYAPDARRVVKTEYRDTRGDGTTYDQWRDELMEMRL